MADKLDLSSLTSSTKTSKKSQHCFLTASQRSPTATSWFDLQELNHDVIEAKARLEWPGKRQAMVNITPRPCVLSGKTRWNLTTRKTFTSKETTSSPQDPAGELPRQNQDDLHRPALQHGEGLRFKDNFTQDSDEYKEESGQTDEYNRRLVSNPDTSGRYHSDWLSMMYPRLKLARNLLSQDGMCLISIDHNEVNQLTLLCADIFGENNVVTTLIWHNNVKGRQLDKHIKGSYEYVLVLAKDVTCLQVSGIQEKVKLDKLQKDNISFFKKVFLFKV